MLLCGMWVACVQRIIKLKVSGHNNIYMLCTQCMCGESRANILTVYRLAMCLHEMSVACTLHKCSIYTSQNIYISCMYCSRTTMPKVGQAAQQKQCFSFRVKVVAPRAAVAPTKFTSRASAFRAACGEMTDFLHDWLLQQQQQTQIIRVWVMVFVCVCAVRSCVNVLASRVLWALKIWGSRWRKVTPCAISKRHS